MRNRESQYQVVRLGQIDLTNPDSDRIEFGDEGLSVYAESVFGNDGTHWHYIVLEEVFGYGWPPSVFNRLLEIIPDCEVDSNNWHDSNYMEFLLGSSYANLRRYWKLIEAEADSLKSHSD